jgi:hypothetical protein
MLPSVPPCVRLVYGDQDVLRIPDWDRQIAHRLLHRLDMAGVWTRLTQLASNDETLPSDFFAYACVVPKRWADVSKMPTGAARKALNGLDKKAVALGKQIVAKSDAVKLAGGSFTLSSLVATSLRARRSNRTLSQTESEMIRILDTYGSGEGEEPLPDLLEILGRVGKTLDPGALKIGVPRRPTKPGDRKARQTFLAQELFRFFHARGCNITLADLATIVNTMEDGDTLEGSWVNKLIRVEKQKLAAAKRNISPP